MRAKVRVLLNKPHYCGEAYSVDDVTGRIC